MTAAEDVRVTTDEPTLESRYREVMRRVGAAAERSGRKPADIVTVAVTKYAEIDTIRKLIDLGHQHLGENKVQQLVQRAAMVDEYLARRSSLPGASADPVPEAPRWHMIGHLQRNKAKKCAEVVRLIHSVDSLRLAEELQAIALRRDEVIEVLVQVNCSEEPQKYGCAVPATEPLCRAIEGMSMLRVRGLMTMAEDTQDEAIARSTFSRGKEIFDDIATTGVGDGRFNILSMGMSNDYEIAIEEGSNLVRIGSAIIGERVDPVDED